MAKPARNLKTFFDTLAQSGQLSQDSVLAFIVAIRRMIEEDSSQGNFKTLWFYCNWCLHTEISRGLTRDWLIRISDCLRDDGKKEWYSDSIARVMSLNLLRTDLITLVKSKGFQTILFDGLSNWKAFLTMLFFHLAETPLVQTAPEPPDAKKRIWVTSVRLKRAGDDPQCLVPAAKAGDLCWFIETALPNIVVIAPVALPELTSAFKLP